MKHKLNLLNELQVIALLMECEKHQNEDNSNTLWQIREALNRHDKKVEFLI